MSWSFSGGQLGSDGGDQRLQLWGSENFVLRRVLEVDVHRHGDAALDDQDLTSPGPRRGDQAASDAGRRRSGRTRHTLEGFVGRQIRIVS